MLTARPKRRSRDDYIHGDFNINRFIYLVLLFVMSIIFLIISPNIISILLGTHEDNLFGT